MASIDDYKRQYDLLFQQIDEKARLGTQAREAEIAELMKRKRVQKAIANLARLAGILPDAMREKLENEVRKRDLDT